MQYAACDVGNRQFSLMLRCWEREMGKESITSSRGSVYTSPSTHSKDDVTLWPPSVQMGVPRMIYYRLTVCCRDAVGIKRLMFLLSPGRTAGVKTAQYPNLSTRCKLSCIYFDNARR